MNSCEMKMSKRAGKPAAGKSAFGDLGKDRILTGEKAVPSGRRTEQLGWLHQYLPDPSMWLQELTAAVTLRLFGVCSFLTVTSVWHTDVCLFPWILRVLYN